MEPQFPETDDVLERLVLTYEPRSQFLFKGSPDLSLTLVEFEVSGDVRGYQVSLELPHGDFYELSESTSLESAKKDFEKYSLMLRKGLKVELDNETMKARFLTER